MDTKCIPALLHLTALHPVFATCLLRATIFASCCYLLSSCKHSSTLCGDPFKAKVKTDSAYLLVPRNDKSIELERARLAQSRRQRVNELEEMRRHKASKTMGIASGALMGIALGACIENSTEKLEQGIRCPGNMVISPYRPKSKAVPIKLLPPPPQNVMVCPHTKKKFIVPQTVQPAAPEEGGHDRGSLPTKPGIRPTSSQDSTADSSSNWTLIEQIREWRQRKSQQDSPPEVSP